METNSAFLSQVYTHTNVLPTYLAELPKCIIICCYIWDLVRHEYYMKEIHVYITFLFSGRRWPFMYYSTLSTVLVGLIGIVAYQSIQINQLQAAVQHIRTGGSSAGEWVSNVFVSVLSIHTLTFYCTSRYTWICCHRSWVQIITVAASVVTDFLFWASKFAVSTVEFTFNPPTKVQLYQILSHVCVWAALNTDDIAMELSNVVSDTLKVELKDWKDTLLRTVSYILVIVPKRCILIWESHI